MQLTPRINWLFTGAKVYLFLPMLTAVVGVGFTTVFLVCPHNTSKTNAATIAKFDTERWVLKTRLFWSWKVNVSSRKNIASMGLCTLVSAGFFLFKVWKLVLNVLCSLAYGKMEWVSNILGWLQRLLYGWKTSDFQVLTNGRQFGIAVTALGVSVMLCGRWGVKAEWLIPFVDKCVSGR